MQETCPNPAVPPSDLQLVSIVHDQVTTSSLTVARIFGKQHKDVLRTIRRLAIPNDFKERNFAPNKIKVLNNSTGEEIESVDMTRDGFTILAMGFTGKKAMQFKLAYIEAFNRMEEELRKRSTPSSLPGIPISQEQQRQTQIAISNRVYEIGRNIDRRIISKRYQTIYRAIKNSFMVGSYKAVPSERFEDLMHLIQTVELPQKDAPKAIEGPANLKDMMIEVKREILQEIQKGSTSKFELPPETWRSTWQMLCECHTDLNAAVDKLRQEVIRLLPNERGMIIPKGVDPMDWIASHYIPLERAVRQLNILSEILLWRSPKVLDFNLALGRPRY